MTGILIKRRTLDKDGQAHRGDHAKAQGGARRRHRWRDIATSPTMHPVRWALGERPGAEPRGPAEGEASLPTPGFQTSGPRAMRQ